MPASRAEGIIRPRIYKKKRGKGKGPTLLSQGRTPSSAREGHNPDTSPEDLRLSMEKGIYLARCDQSFTDTGATYSRARENKGCLLCAVCCDGSSRLTPDRRPRNSLPSGINRAMNTHVRLLMSVPQARGAGHEEHTLII